MSSMITNLSPKSIGYKMKWLLNQDTYRVAIITKNGVLQVKSVTEGNSDYITTTPLKNGRYPLRKILFETEDAWRASLPENGVVEVTPSQEMRTFHPNEDYMTIEKLKAITEKWEKECNEMYERALANCRRQKALRKASMRKNT